MEEFVKRKPNRLSNYDYSQNGAYFITICTYNRKCILSDIVGAIHELPVVNLTVYGRIVDKIIADVQKRFDAVISNYIIMPNHIHMLLEITNGKRAIRELPLQKTHSTVSNIVGYLKMNSAKEIHKINKDIKVWQRSYYDHIVRNDVDYEEIWNYIENNSLKWKEDRFYCDVM